ncbi:fumarylacetoacetate hydrolase family protein [Mycobacterium sp. E796]|uniref:fumarylacetoacetate hydrolase family protein n=1 Tax=Mycobacterium sp. E796 TaxID=1834151 RepID=UPI0007FE9E57|nr:fumarylacetoacetate hydrolase family protein [Mycobacterium sp. E796]OBI52979.1 fumarylacetoacetase [Mycobacterium sp. E796]
MLIRRVLSDDRVVVEAFDDGQWRQATDPGIVGAGAFDPRWQLLAAQRQLAQSRYLLPIQPLSFRDFMVYERHTIDASRGLLRRFHPAQYRVASTIEKLTRRPFPLFKPKRLFFTQPIYYMSNHLTFVPSGTPVAPPSYSHALDYELEIGFVLSAPLFNASPAEAIGAVGAFVVLNDFSARDVQRKEMDSGFGPQKSKHFASSMSATAVTADEILPRIDAVQGTVAINGTTVSTVSSEGMQWSIGEMLAHASRSERLLPGELFGTGTLPGGSGMETGAWLQRGDMLSLRLDGIGEIEHRITG